MSNFVVREWRDNGERVIDVEDEHGEQWFSQFLPEEPMQDARIINTVEAEAQAMLAWVSYVRENQSDNE